MSALANTAAFLLAALGVVAIDQMLVAARRSDAERAAGEAAVYVRGFLAVHEQALQVMRTLYLGGRREVRGEDFAAVIQILEDHVPAFSRLWLTDSSGVIQHEWAFDNLSAPGLLGADLDTLRTLELRAIAQMARRYNQPQSSNTGRLFSGEQGFAVLQPIRLDHEFVAFAGGTITGAAVLSALDSLVSSVPFRRIILAANDTVAADEAPPAGLMTPRAAAAELTAPGGSPWQVIMLYDSGYAGRPVLWIVALLLLGTLTVAFVHTRRQAIRLADRTVELERLSAELLRANRAKSEFLASVSHELRTPLNAIVGFVEMLRDGVYGEMTPRQTAPIGRVASSATHLRHLVDQILDIAKLAAGRMEFHTEPVDVRGLVIEVASEIEPLLNDRDLHLQLVLPPALPRISTDRTHLRQIVLNLLGNAIKYTPEGGIVVEARTDDSSMAPEHLIAGPPPSAVTGEMSNAPPASRWVSISVSDSGIGIAPSDYDRIFEEFEQVNAGPRTDSMVRGTGLGLAISRRLARLIGGDVTVKSDLGKGSTFTVWLPADA
ncbi:MAG TPA: HAMP domain-containing sensor histidine kinase [Gemmatimonadaceae bacterium]|nr:HAMP domain-containing sensor histidine kinase [Gemmatimonadaceae bacterium]